MRFITLVTGLLLGTTFGASAQTATTARAESRWQHLSHPNLAHATGHATVARGIVSISRPGRAVHHRWSSVSNSWTKATIDTYGYDSQGRLTQEAFADSATATPTDRSLYSYNAQGQGTEELYQEWDGTAWVNSGRYSATYDARGGLTDELFQEWTGSAWRTFDGLHYVLTYNPAGVLTGQIEQHLTNGVFVNHEQLLFTVSANNQWTSVVQQLWDQGTWQNEARIAYTWHNWSQQQLATYLEDSWQGQWQPLERGTFVYAANDSYTLTTEKQEDNSGWQNGNREKLVFDGQQNQTEYTYESWDNAAWMLEFGSRSLLRYAATGELLRQVKQEFDPNRSSGYVNSELYTYSSFVLLANQAKANRLLAAEAYPNPTTGQVTLRWNSAARNAEVLNVLGQAVRTEQLPAGSTSHTFDLSALPKGVYSIRVQAADGTVSKRLVKE